MNIRRSPLASGATQPALDVGALTRAVRRGDEAAFEQFYETYCDRLHRLLLALTRGRDDVSREVLQTVMIKLARKLPVIESEAELWSWLARVTRNALMDHWRRKTREIHVLDANAEKFCDSTGEPGGEAPMMDWLEAAVEALDSDDRWLVREFYHERRSHQELAVALGKTPKAIESKLARLRQTLRAALNQRQRSQDEQE